jgi:UDP-2,3-diacylglucosamine hydrolase
VSDLHLSAERPSAFRQFQSFLSARRHDPGALFILGDLFDYWIGDDDLDEPFHAAVVGALAELSAAGSPVYLMHGNRDFLLGEVFAAAAGVQLLSDPCVVEQGGERCLLLHGDTLCVDDPDYQAFRAQVRAPAWRQGFLGKALAERRRIALQLRADSQSSQQYKSDTIMDVTPAAVEEAFRRWHCTRMIHGHTHRPLRHAHRVDGRICERWVLGDWYETGSFLRCDAAGRCEALTLATDAKP